jgi:hypothetical protein
MLGYVPCVHIKRRTWIDRCYVHEICTSQMMLIIIFCKAWNGRFKYSSQFYMLRTLYVCECWIWNPNVILKPLSASVTRQLYMRTHNVKLHTHNEKCTAEWLRTHWRMCQTLVNQIQGSFQLNNRHRVPAWWGSYSSGTPVQITDHLHVVKCWSPLLSDLHFIHYNSDLMFPVTTLAYNCPVNSH